MERYVIKHPGLEAPLLIGPKQHAALLAAQDAGQTSVTLGKVTIPVNGITATPHALFLAMASQELRKTHRYICWWGGFHQNEDTGNHERCKETMYPGNPYVSPNVLDAAADPKPQLPSA